MELLIILFSYTSVKQQNIYLKANNIKSIPGNFNSTWDFSFLHRINILLKEVFKFLFGKHGINYFENGLFIVII